MTNRIFALGAAALMTLFTAACQPDRVKVPAPDWTEDLTIDNVTKRSARLTNADGESFRVSRYGTDIGDGLTAYRTKRRLYVEDENGVRCRWNRREVLQDCTKPAPQAAP